MRDPQQRAFFEGMFGFPIDALIEILAGSSRFLTTKLGAEALGLLAEL